MRTGRNPAGGLVAASLATIVLLAGCGSSHRGPATAGASGPAPACLPTTFDHSGALAGTGLDVSPEPGSMAASPQTQISLLGRPRREILSVSASGSATGAHPGHLVAYSQGDGVSFVPDRPFTPQERVTVHVSVQTAAGPRSARFQFRTDTPASTAGYPQYPHPAAAPGDVQVLHSLPGLQPPTVTVTADQPSALPGDILLTPDAGDSQWGLMILNDQGQTVWFKPLPSGEAAGDLAVQRYGGRRVLTWWQGRLLIPGFGQGEDVIAGDHYQTLAVVRAGNGLSADLHEFALEPNGTALIAAYNPIRCNLSPARGGPREGVLLDNAVQEIDVKTGAVRLQWDSLDHIAVMDTFQPPTPQPWDYFHLNSVDLEPSGNLLISARNTWAIYQLQGGSGALQWTLGGKHSSFQIQPGAHMAWQHDAQMLPNGAITIFDDETRPGVYNESRAIELAVNTHTRTASILASFKHPTSITSATQGSTQLLPNGDWMVGWGQVPYFTEFAPDGHVLFDGHLPFASASYRARVAPWQAAPPQPPAVSATILSGNATAIYASWNGSTALSGWRVMAGTARNDLYDFTTVPRSGFETQILIQDPERYVQVQALGANGHVLAQSPIVTATGTY
ncbi:MAG TPA: arylsulfotransferase family protein [Solirubrobacteraceae bacterium]|jgi:hypothetical protein|nr:arylsulfotransferase family protein [Solirubrobacteraceae bacterium]